MTTNRKSTAFHLRIPNGLADQLKEEADTCLVTPSTVIRWALADYFDAEESQRVRRGLTRRPPLRHRGSSDAA